MRGEKTVKIVALSLAAFTASNSMCCCCCCCLCFSKLLAENWKLHDTCLSWMVSLRSPYLPPSAVRKREACSGSSVSCEAAMLFIYAASRSAPEPLALASSAASLTGPLLSHQFTNTHTHSHALTCTHKHTRRGRERRGRAASLRGVRTPTERTAAPPPLCGGLQALNSPPNCHPNRHANSALVLHGLSTTDGQQLDEFGDKTSQKLSCNAQECIFLLFNSRERLFLLFSCYYYYC